MWGRTGGVTVSTLRLVPVLWTCFITKQVAMTSLPAVSLEPCFVTVGNII